MRQLYLSDYERWQKNNESIARKNVENKDSHEAALKEWEKRKEEFTRSQKNDIELWNNRLEEYLSQQNKKNAEIDELNKLYSAKKPKGVIYYCNQVLCQASYPLDFPLEFGLDYKAETGLLQINYLLPNIEHMPKVKRVEYVKTEGGIVDVNYSNDEKKALNDSYNYQIVLRTMYLLYKADTAGTLNTIRFNGFVTKVDGATGKDLRKTVVSAEIDRQEFLQFNLKIIDPQICVEEYNS